MKKKNNNSNINYTYKKEDLIKMIELDNLLKKYNCPGLKFYEVEHVKRYDDYYSAWNIDDILNVDKEIEKSLERADFIFLNDSENAFKKEAIRKNNIIKRGF